MTTAVVGAGVVALGFGTVLPDLPKPSGLALVDVTLDGTLPTDLAARAAADRAAADRASRTEVRTTGDTAKQAAPNIWVLPLRSYYVSSPFGWRWGRMHNGVDLAADYGTQYRAAAHGRVILANWYGGYGNCIVIDHGDGISTVYGHSSKLMVTAGQTVEPGDVIGLVGNTGHSFGPHLHFEVRKNNVPIEPVAWVKAKGVDIVRHIDPLTG
jgi:murein DD-endopeptidase MepM/ murein hydrolase activator NlpD